MKRNLSLDDAMLFLAVARAGGLAGAARATGASVPTLSRRMTAFETALGARLFLRGARGYALTARGLELREALVPLAAAEDRLRHFANGSGPVRVRITAGHWTSRFLAQHIDRIWSPEAGWVPVFLASNADVDIARREADIGIRNRPPAQDWLAGRRTLEIRYAPFAREAGVAGYIGLPEGAASTPSERWVRARHGGEVVTEASHVRLAMDLARAGMGQLVLPLFAGAREPGLVQSGPVVDEITHDEWLVCHHEARHDPGVREALDAIADLLGDRSLRG